MNRPSRIDEPQTADGHSQSLLRFTNGQTTNLDLNGFANSRVLRREQNPAIADPQQVDSCPPVTVLTEGHGKTVDGVPGVIVTGSTATSSGSEVFSVGPSGPSGPEPDGHRRHPPAASSAHDFDEALSSSTAWLSRARHIIITFGKFIGPGFMVAVAYSTGSFPGISQQVC